MKKYLLVGLCLLAFVAGGAAQLALHRSGRDTAPPPTERIAEAPAPPESNPAAATPAAPQAEPAAPEVAIEEAEVVDSQDAEKAGVSETSSESRRVVRASNRAPATTGRNSLRAAPAVRRASVTPAPARNASRDDGVHEKAASGAKKTGRWVGKGLKKIGGVFHD